MITDDATQTNTDDSADAGTVLTEPTFTESLGVKDDSLKDFESADALAQAFLDKNREFEEFKTTVPALPESPDQYTFEGEGNIDEDTMGEFKKLAHENGIPQSAFQKIVEFDIARNKQMMDSFEAAEAEQIESLKGEWKNKFDANIEVARRAVKHFGGEGLAKYLDDSRLGNHSEMIKMFQKIGTLISEDALHSGPNHEPGPKRPQMEDGKPMLNFPSMQK